ncbi:MAG: ABC transporter permease [Nonomuraea sp.]|nr:ABC transporter permease [Nonomuraea sp.]
MVAETLSLKAVRRNARLYRRSLGAVVRAVLEYVADFWILIAAGIVTQSLGLVFLSVVMSRVPHLNGWSYPEMVLIYGLAGVSSGIVPVLSDGIWQLASFIHNGQLDYALTRPAPPLMQVMSAWVGFNGVGDLVASAAMLTWALTRVDVHWTPLNVLILLVLMISGIALRLAMCVVANTVSFWLRMPMPMFAMTAWQVGELARYPLGIYGFGLRFLLGAAAPFAFAGFFPAAWLLDRGGYAWLGILTPVVAVLWWIFAVWLFRRGLRRYESAGH